MSGVDHDGEAPKSAQHRRDTYEDVRALIDRLLPSLHVTSIFDVGANIGQSTALLLQSFPGAHVWAFEPVPATFGELKARIRDNPAVTCLNVALSATDGEAQMVAQGHRPTNRLVSSNQRALPTATVTLRRGSGVMSEFGIDRIGYLKIDTEGHDLDVLRGLEDRLHAQTIDLLEVESGLHPGNTRHVPFEQFKAYLEPLGYLLFHIREMVPERGARQNLRRCNMVFASTAILDANPRKASAG